MIEHFPGLRSLRAFDAAAKHLSFTRAAEVMGVTPAAISHQIKELEDQLRLTLFVRTSRTMRLTREGEILHPCAPPHQTVGEPQSNPRIIHTIGGRQMVGAAP
jgi:Bacterial regulatory helix-turn-helix protein, lysR family